jgi:enoyl-CoA hydratase/carnithine racemase
VRLILLDANGRAFCAGGDIIALQQNKRSVSNIKSSASPSDGIYYLHKSAFKSTIYAEAFFRHQYTLDFLLSVYPKPILTFLNGYTAGGGAGLSFHPSHRIVNLDAFNFAMPECTIGLTPDVGFSYILSSLPIGVGEYIGLTGRTFNGIDMDFFGFFDATVDATGFAALKEVIMHCINWKEMLVEIPCTKNFNIVTAWINSRKSRPLAPNGHDSNILTSNKPCVSIFAKHFNLIRNAFTANTVEDILLRLQNLASKEDETIPSGKQAFILECLSMMKQNSPTSMMITLRTLQANRILRKQLSHLSQCRLEQELLRQALKTEFRVCLRMVTPYLPTSTFSTSAAVKRPS